MLSIRSLAVAGTRLTSGLRSIATTNARRFLTTTSRCLTSNESHGSSGTAKQSFDEFRAQEERKEEEYEKSSKSESTQQTDQESKKSDEEVTSVKSRVLEASLPFVTSHGWSKVALAKGAESLGLPGIAHGMFPRAGAELIDHFNARCNKQLIEYMEEMCAKPNKDPPTVFAAKAIEARLRMLDPYLSQWPQALAIMTLPPNVPVALSNLLTMVDDICYYAGDRSVDFNWYTRRLGLASIYKAAELFMLQDKSPDHEKTWAFLKHRIEDASKIQDLLTQSEGMTQNLQQTGKSIFETARNILGLNFNRR